MFMSFISPMSSRLIVSLVQRPRIRPERVPVGAFQDDAPAVDIDTVARTHLHGPKAEPLPDRVQNRRSLFQTRVQPV